MVSYALTGNLVMAITALFRNGTGRTTAVQPTQPSANVDVTSSTPERCRGAAFDWLGVPENSGHLLAAEKLIAITISTTNSPVLSYNFSRFISGDSWAIERQLELQRD